MPNIPPQQVRDLTDMCTQIKLYADQVTHSVRRDRFTEADAAVRRIENELPNVAAAVFTFQACQVPEEEWITEEDIPEWLEN